MQNSTNNPGSTLTDPEADDITRRLLEAMEAAAELDEVAVIAESIVYDAWYTGAH